jgi:uncharacterized caspase-like protein
MLNQLTERDSLLVTFSGFGLQFPGEDKYFLCPDDANRADKKTLIALSEVCDALGRTKAASKIVVVDSCRLLEGLGEKKAKTPKPPPKQVAVLFACSAGKAAFESPEAKGGMLTHFLCKGLGGAANANKGGSVTWSELVRYTKAELADYAKAKPELLQVPELIGQTRDLTFVLLKK